jgi:hypothetical protein
VKDDENDQESMEYCEICVYNSVVENIWQRICDHFHADEDEKIEDKKNSLHYWLPVGINPRFRIFKYDDKSVYRRHLDGAWPCGTLDERTNEFIVDTNTLNINKENPKATRLTFLIYLTDSFWGGETTFYSVDSDNNNHEKVIVGNAVVPRRGSVLCFPPGDAEYSPVHEGSKLFSAGHGNNNNDNIHNCKFVVRTDVVFEKRQR